MNVCQTYTDSEGNLKGEGSNVPSGDSFGKIRSLSRPHRQSNLYRPLLSSSSVLHLFLNEALISVRSSSFKLSHAGRGNGFLKSSCIILNTS